MGLPALIRNLLFETLGNTAGAAVAALAGVEGSLEEAERRSLPFGAKMGYGKAVGRGDL
jgi:hypothetical protein